MKNNKLEEEFEAIKQLLKVDVQNLRKDIFRYLHQSRLQFFEQCCPYLTTPMPYKSLVSFKLKPSFTSPVNFSIEEKIEAIDKDCEKIILHPLIDGQILPFQINQVDFDQESIVLQMGNDAGFFYIENNYIDIWVFNEEEILASELFDSLRKAQLELNFILKNRKITQIPKIRKLHYAYLHSNEIFKDQLNNLNFYHGVRLYFENNLIGIEIHQIKLIVSRLDESINKDNLSKAININYVPLINYQEEYALPIRLDGSRDSFPILPDNNDGMLSLLRIFFVEAYQNNLEGAGFQLIYPRMVSNSQELSYDLIRPSVEHNIKNSHIIPYNTTFGRDLSLQIRAAWFNNRPEIGNLSKFSFITKPVESIDIKPVFFSEKEIEANIDLNAMHNVQNLTFQKFLSANDMIALINLLCTQSNIKSKLLPLIVYLKDHYEDVYDLSTLTKMHFVENESYNCYLNVIFQVLLRYHRSLTHSDGG